MKLVVDLEMLTAACLASGRAGGAGDVDTATEVDSAGLPVLRGRTLKGLLVEEAARVLQMEPGAKALERAAATLFGEPERHGARALLSFEDGSVPSIVRDAFLEHRWRGEVLTEVRRQTAIDPKTGAARKGSLRSTRLIRAGVVLRCAVRAERPLNAAERALFAACVASLRRVGLHRNEGWGRVRCALRDDAGVDITGAWLRGLDCPSEEQPESMDASTEALTPPSASEGRTVVLFNLTLRRPLLIADRARGDWVTSSLSYIPGSVILGACAARWLASKQCADPSIEPDFRRLFLDGSTRWLNAYPLDGSARSLPVPLCWRLNRSDTVILDTLHPESGELLDNPDVAREWVGLDEGQYSTSTATCERVRLISPARTSRMHHERDRELGRSKGGELFVHDALDAGQTFASAVLCEDGETAAAISAMLAGATLEFGRSRTATYGGGVEITDLRSVSALDWSERQTVSDVRALVLTSDYLGRSGTGAPDPGAILDELATELGLSRDALDFPDRDLRGRVVHGQVGRWQMPRPAHVALAAGSVIALPTDGAIDAKRLSALLWRGVGERRAEGFGRICLLDVAEEAQRNLDKQAPPKQSTVVEYRCSEDALMLQSVRRWVCLSHLRAEMAGSGNALGARLRAASPSLVARIRQAVRLAKSLDEVEAFVQSLAGGRAKAALQRVADGRSFEQGVLGRCKNWREEYQGELPSGVSPDDLKAEDIWVLQQHWLDVVLERWRREMQKEVL